MVSDMSGPVSPVGVPVCGPGCWPGRLDSLRLLQVPKVLGESTPAYSPVERSLHLVVFEFVCREISSPCCRKVSGNPFASFAELRHRWQHRLLEVGCVKFD